MFRSVHGSGGGSGLGGYRLHTTSAGANRLHSLEWLTHAIEVVRAADRISSDESGDGFGDAVRHTLRRHGPRVSIDPRAKLPVVVISLASQAAPRDV